MRYLKFINYLGIIGQQGEDISHLRRHLTPAIHMLYQSCHAISYRLSSHLSLSKTWFHKFHANPIIISSNNCFYELSYKTKKKIILRQKHAFSFFLIADINIKKLTRMWHAVSSREVIFLGIKCNNQWIALRGMEMTTVVDAWWVRVLGLRAVSNQ